MLVCVYIYKGAHERNKIKLYLLHCGEEMLLMFGFSLSLHSVCVCFPLSVCSYST